MVVPSFQEHPRWLWRSREERNRRRRWRKRRRRRKRQRKKRSRRKRQDKRELGSEWACYTHVLLVTFKWDKIILDSLNLHLVLFSEKQVDIAGGKRRTTWERCCSPQPWRAETLYLPCYLKPREPDQPVMVR